MDFYKIQEKLKNGYSFPLLEIEDIKYIQKPLGKAIYKNALGRPPKNNINKVNPNDKIKCSVCGKIFTRNNRWKHNKTQLHQAYLQINNKLSKLLLDEK